MSNDNCQALYMHNFSEGVQDKQLVKLAEVLRRGNIWCLNLGENKRISMSSWRKIAQDIRDTNVTVSASKYS